MDYVQTLSLWDRIVINLKASLSTWRLEWEELTETSSPAILRHEHENIIHKLPKDLVEVLTTFGDNYSPLARLENFAIAYERNEGDKEYAKKYFMHLEAYMRVYNKTKESAKIGIKDRFYKP